MNFGFTEEQELLRAEVRKFLDENAPLERVRELTEPGGDCGPELWGQIAELGWVGLTMPEEYGGVGLDLETMIVVLEETGRSLFPSPLISTVLAAKAIERFGSADQQARWLPGLANGSRVGTFAFLERSDCFSAAGVETAAKADGDELILSGDKLFVTDAGRADFFVVAVRGGSESDALSLVVIEKELAGVSAGDLDAMDLTWCTRRSGLRAG
jgi:alkylation response protein AidB-like acyl-CoA dehydrogenase